MVSSVVSLLLATAIGSSAYSIPDWPLYPSKQPWTFPSRDSVAQPSSGCQNTPSSRQCWGEYDINTDYYEEIFHTGVTREYWLNIEEIDCTPDGYLTRCQVANGTMPGPALVADWGDDIVVHVTNNIPTNGTGIHWHGVRQLNTNEYDGVPGVTQCPIAPGETFTYKFHASQYGTTMWHSHFSLQYSMGLYGALIINGPSTANWDEALEPVFFTDWNHLTAFQEWATVADFNVTFSGALTGLVNGVNTGNCTLTNVTMPDSNCISEGEKYVYNFESGKKYKMSIINIANEAWFQFSIDNHTMTVISNDFVPIVPYQTESLLINAGQRYDVIVEADAPPGEYWLRSGLNQNCLPNGYAENITAIVRYDRNSIKIPESISQVVQATNTCVDEPSVVLQPWLQVHLPNMDGGIHLEDLTGEYVQNNTYIRWQMNHTTWMWTNWTAPALGDVVSNNLANIPVSDNVFHIGTDNTSAAPYTNTTKYQWVVLVMEDQTPIIGISHPIHLHGHDFLVLHAAPEQWDGTTNGWIYNNPPRRDTATMPINGHIVLAWRIDNPGVWAIHCHIPWHSSQGFAATVLESPGLINKSGATDNWESEADPVCEAWDRYLPTMPYKQEDSGL